MLSRTIITCATALLITGCSEPTITEVRSGCECPAPPTTVLPHEHPHEHEAAPPLYVAGTRLTPRTMTATDGAHSPAPNVWDDASLGVDCSFVQAPNERFVCMPKAAPVQNFYADATCKQRVAIAPSCEALPHYGREKTPDGCGGLDVGILYPLDIKNVITSGTVYWLGSGGCQPQPSMLGTSNVALPVLDALPPDALVEATIDTASVP